MSLSGPQRERAIEWLRDLFDEDLTKVLLSVLIILSVLPFTHVQSYSMVFFGIFAVELFFRSFIFFHDLRRRSLNRVEFLILLFDVVATLSFLPLEALWGDVRYLRLFRLSRMLLLFGYWGPIVREIWFILMKRERRYQIFFVGASVLILTFLSAILLEHFQSYGVDFNEDGDPGNDRSFWAMLWWAFRQIQDPGNLLKDAQASLAFFFSVFLTICGLFIFSFLIGIGTSVVEELVLLGRERRIGMRRHSVICNIDEHSRVLLEELVTYYTKSFRSPRILAMGSCPGRYPFMLQGPSQRVRYRHGRPLSPHDLQKVDADRATRVILLAEADRDLSDSEVISQILSVRQVNPGCEIYAEILRPDNMQAALAAGGERTVPILAGQLTSLFLANILLFPGVQEIYGELLSSRGDEVYTCLFDRGAMTGFLPPSGPLLPFGELLERCHRAHGVVLLGYLLKDETRPGGFVHELNPGSTRAELPPPPFVPGVDRLLGFFGIADNFQRLRSFVESLPDVAAEPAERRATPPLPRLGTCPAATRLGQILICGFHEGIVDFCEQLILFAGRPSMHIMVTREDQVQGVIQAFVSRVEEAPASLVPGRRVRFSPEGTCRIRFAVQGGEGEGGIIQVLHGDWSDERVMLSPAPGELDLAELDAVLFTYAPTEHDPDARSALGLFKLIRLRDTRPGLLRPHLRIACEVLSSDKAELYQQRFAPDSPGGGCHPLVVVPAQRLRNSLLAQAVFVPGIGPIYREILSETGQEIYKLLVLDPGPEPDAVWTFTELLGQLYLQREMILIAVEINDPESGQRRIVVNPQPRGEGFRFAAGQLVGLFAVGDSLGLPRAASSCAGCRIPARDTPDPESDR